MRWRGRVAQWLARAARRLDDWALGSVFTLRWANAKVRRRLQADAVEQYRDDPRLQHSTAALTQALASSLTRLEAIEGKARATLIGIAPAVAILSFGSTILGDSGALADGNCPVRVAAAALLFGGIVFLLRSGQLALRAYRVVELFQPELGDLEPIARGRDARCVILFCIEQNSRVVTMQANILSACFSCVRNGLLLVAALGALVVAVSV